MLVNYGMLDHCLLKTPMRKLFRTFPLQREYVLLNLRADLTNIKSTAHCGIQGSVVAMQTKRKSEKRRQQKAKMIASNLF